jgi:hypothetical protein
MGMDRVKKYLNEGIPFVVCQYFEGFIWDEEARFKVYDIVYYDGNEIRTDTMSSESVRTFYSNFDKFVEKTRNVNGCVWEFKNFKVNCPKFAKDKMLAKIKKAEDALIREQQKINAQIAKERRELALKLKMK